MTQHKVDSSNIEAGVFDDSKLPGIFAKIATAEKEDKELTAQKSRALIADIVFNQENEFTVADIRNQIIRDYGITFSEERIENVIEWLYTENCVEYDRCDKTIDLFGVAAWKQQRN